MPYKQKHHAFPPKIKRQKKDQNLHSIELNHNQLPTVQKITCTHKATKSSCKILAWSTIKPPPYPALTSQHESYRPRRQKRQQ